VAAETIRELIAKDAARTVGLISRADGYTLDIRTVHPWKTSRFTELELDGAAVYDPVDVPAPKPRDNIYEHREMLLIVELWTRRPLDDVLIGPTLNAMIGDGYRAMMLDPRRSRRAEWSFYGEVGTIIEKDLLGVQAHWRIPYRHLLGDATQPI